MVGDKYCYLGTPTKGIMQREGSGCLGLGNLIGVPLCAVPFVFRVHPLSCWASWSAALSLGYQHMGNCNSADKLCTGM